MYTRQFTIEFDDANKLVAVKSIQEII